MSWSSLWQQRHGSAATLLAFLPPVDLLSVLRVDRETQRRIRILIRKYQHDSARVGLALWLQRQAVLSFQAQYQVLTTRTIPRGAELDPRVPPRVVSTWTEQGTVDGGCVGLNPSELPIVHREGVILTFTASDGGAEPAKQPMLMNVVQQQRRMYTMVRLALGPAATVTLPQPVDVAADRAAAEQGNSERTLRTYCYLKEFGEWQTPTVTEKRRYEAAGALCRYDLVSLDGSVTLELDVPRGADALVDYYLVKKAVVCLPMSELLQRYVQSLRPLRSLPPPSVPQSCVMTIRFGDLRGRHLSPAYTLEAMLLLEQQAPPASQTTSAPRARLESVDVVTCQAILPEEATPVRFQLPTEPGYVWLRIVDQSTAQMTFFSAMLHQGAQQITAPDVESSVLTSTWLPGVLETAPAPNARLRRCLKGRLRATTALGALRELALVAQVLPMERLQPYAARVSSYTRPE